MVGRARAGRRADAQVPGAHYLPFPSKKAPELISVCACFVLAWCGQGMNA